MKRDLRSGSDGRVAFLSGDGGPGRPLVLLLQVLVLVLAAPLLLGGCAGGAGVRAEGPSTGSGTSLEERWGIRVESLRLTAAGMMVDFRYRVLDPEKAVTLLRSEDKPVLIDEATGTRFVVPTPPKVGALRSVDEHPEGGRIYFMLFANPGRFLKPESRVSVVMGDFVAEGLVLQ